jgi:hypothetical protein
MSRRITQRELRNDSGRIMLPLRQRAFVPSELAHAAFASAPSVAAKRFRRDVDAFIDQTVTLRG